MTDRVESLAKALRPVTLVEAGRVWIGGVAFPGHSVNSLAEILLASLDRKEEAAPTPHPVLAKYGLEGMAGDPLEVLERHLLANAEATIGAWEAASREEAAPTDLARLLRDTDLPEGEHGPVVPIMAKLLGELLGQYPDQGLVTLWLGQLRAALASPSVRSDGLDPERLAHAYNNVLLLQGIGQPVTMPLWREVAAEYARLRDSDG